MLERGPVTYNNFDPDETGVGVPRRPCRRRHLGPQADMFQFQTEIKQKPLLFCYSPRHPV